MNYIKEKTKMMIDLSSKVLGDIGKLKDNMNKQIKDNPLYVVCGIGLLVGGSVVYIKSEVDKVDEKILKRFKEKAGLGKIEKENEDLIKILCRNIDNCSKIKKIIESSRREIENKHLKLSSEITDISKRFFNLEKRRLELGIIEENILALNKPDNNKKKVMKSGVENKIKKVMIEVKKINDCFKDSSNNISNVILKK